MKERKRAQWGLFFIIIFSALTLPLNANAEALQQPLLPLVREKVAVVADPGRPVRVIIPAINLDSKILSLGKEKNGEMSVPSGKSNDVGWYKYGTVPGNMGSAVLDAHVFAAFANLNKLKSGDNIFVLTDKGEKLRFVVGEAKTYKLNALSPNTLFHQNDAKRLNLITCAGSLTKDKSTYTHRHVVFAVLADTYVA
jgi:sortase (surface protein transpeptidase)